MKKSELISSLKIHHEQNNGKASVIFLVLYITGMMAFTPFIKIVEDNPIYGILWFILFFGYLIGFPYIWMKFKGVKPIKLQCPTCESKLRGFQIQIAIASNNCPICGELIFKK